MTLSALGGTAGAAVVAALVLAAAALFTWGIVSLVLADRGPRLDEALAPYRVGGAGAKVERRSAATTQLVESTVLQRAVEGVGRLAARQGLLQWLEQKLDQAESTVKPAEALVVYGLALVLGTAIGFLAGHLVGAVVAFAVIGATPWLGLEVLAGRKAAAFAAQLPDMLQLLATTLRSGFSLMQGLDTIAKQLPDPAGEGIRQVVAEARLGRPLHEALADLAERVHNSDFEWVVTAIAIQREVGGNLAELLDIVAETMNARSNMRREVRTLTAEGRLSAVIIALLPVAIGLFVYLVNPSYIRPLFHTGTGKFFFFGAIVLGVLGIVWMQKIVDIEI